MKKKGKLLIILILLLLISGVFGYYILTKKDNKNALTIIEKNWVEQIKKEVIDINIANNLPIFSYDGQGIFFNFLTDLEEEVGIKFNKLPYNETVKGYSFKLVSETNENQIVMYEDTYAIISKNKVKYNNLNDVANMKIGILESDLENAQKYLNGDFEFKTYSSETELFESIIKSEEDDYVIIAPKTLYLKVILENDLYVSYNITEMINYYVLELGENEKLNQILTKYYKKWNKESYSDLYSKYFSNIYLSFKGIDEKTKTTFKSKTYKYGYVNNIPFEGMIGDTEVGFNIHLVKNFAKFAGIDVEYIKYNKISTLNDDFKNRKIDLLFNYFDTKNSKTYDTVSIYDEKIIVLSKISNNNVMNSLYSLNNKDVVTIKSSKIEQYLKENGIEVKSYSNMDNLIKKLKDSSIIVIDMDTYNYYKNSNLSDYKIDYQFYLDSDYNYVINNKNNEIFIDFFDFYLSFINEKSVINSEFSSLLKVKDNSWMYFMIIPILLSIYGTYTLFMNISKLFIKVTKKKDNLTKEDKLRYIDSLTSLKNRSYLNDNIEKWDNSEIYPQCIIIADLNNVAYINDNYGHEEGDKLIKEAANILIRNQIINSEIIRTDGNEFLLYLVGYDEKQIVSYIKKLNKEFKELTHGFGVAIGYSMINDAIKTIDDAVNEATIEMKNSKEESGN